MTLTVAELVQAPVMWGAPVLAGQQGVNREINWTAVIEWQAVGFVHPGELVLTLGFERAPFEVAVAGADAGLERVARDLRDRATRASLELVLGVRDGVLVAAAPGPSERGR